MTGDDTARTESQSISGCAWLVLAAFGAVGLLLLLVALAIFGMRALGVVVFCCVPFLGYLTQKSWAIPFILVLEIQIVAAFMAKQVFDAWVPESDCTALTFHSSGEDFGIHSYGRYRCAGEALLPMVYPGLLSLLALPFVFARGKTLLAALVATATGLLPVLIWAREFTSGDVFVTRTEELLRGTELELEGYVSSVAAFWMLTLAGYLGFWFWGVVASQRVEEESRRALAGNANTSDTASGSISAHRELLVLIALAVVVVLLWLFGTST